MEMNNYFPSPFTVCLVQGSVAIPTAIQPGRRTGLEVWRCRHPRPRRKSSPPSLPPFFPPCLPPSSPWKRSSFSLWESTKGKKEKELSIKLSRASGAFSRGCHSLWGEQGALKTDFKRTVQPQLHCTASSSLQPVKNMWHWKTQWHLPVFCFPQISTASHWWGQPGPLLFVGCPVMLPRQPDPYWGLIAGTTDLVGLLGPSLPAKNISGPINVASGTM